MIHFLYGEDNFSLQVKLKDIEADFIKSEQTDLNITKLNGAKIKSNDLSGAIFSQPFLGNKRLCIIKNLLLEGSDAAIQKYLETNLTKFPDYSVVVFVEEGMPDGRSAFFKALKKLPAASYFPPLGDLEVKRWIEAKIKDNNLTIKSDAAYKLQLFVGADLWRLSNEIDKLSLYKMQKGESEISSADIELMVSAENSPNIFDLTDAIAAKDEKKALKILHQSLLAGEEEMKLFNLIIGQYRKMLIIDDLISHKLPLEKSKLHPFVVKKIQGSLKYFRKNEVMRNYLFLQDIDVKIKTGQIDPKVALDSFIVDCCA